jgi:hypothetical protein
VGYIESQQAAFRGASSFTGIGLENWNALQVQDFSSAFNGDSRLNLQFAFANTASFNQPLPWNTSSETSLKAKFL